jgi:predicted AAA+ superfamily ATPase
VSDKTGVVYARWLEGRLPQTSERTLVLVTGARQTGKTTLARSAYRDLRYLNLDALETRDDLQAISTYEWARAVGPAVLDEAQKLPGVFDKLKFAYDAGELRFGVLLGSSQILMGRRVSETLAGRVLIYDLYPLMLSELLTGQGDALRAPLLERLLVTGEAEPVLATEPSILPGAEGARCRSAEDTLLAWGGMPGLLTLDEARRWDWLRSYEATYLERDLGDLARLHDLQPFRRFQQLAALRTGSLLSYSELARDAGLSVESARRYLEYLRLSYQAFLLPPYSRNLTSRLVKTPKLHWLDPGIWRSLARHTGPATGALYESWLVAEVVKLVRTRGLAAELSYYRTVSGLEADLMIECNGRTFGIEVKQSEHVVPSDGAALGRLADALGAAWGGGMVVYRGRTITRLKDRVWAVPACRLLS